ncbi:135_t:CDS:1, partial [Cetraspora pellucida]
LASLPLTEISCNSLDLTELRIKKCQWQTELTNNSISIKENLNNSDSNCEASANKLFEDLFGHK